MHKKSPTTNLGIPALCEVKSPGLPHHLWSLEKFHQLYPIVAPLPSSSASKLWSRHHKADTIIRVRLWRAHLSVSDSSLEETGLRAAPVVSIEAARPYSHHLRLHARFRRALYLLYAMSRRNPQERTKPIFTCLSRPVLSRRTDNTFPGATEGCPGQKGGWWDFWRSLFLDLNLEVVEKVTGRGLSSNNYTPKLSPTKNYLARHLDHGKKGLSVCFHPTSSQWGERVGLKCEEFEQETEIE